MVKISVLTVTHSRRGHIKRFLDSVAYAAGFEQLEVLILMNGESVETKKWLREYSNRFHNIKLFQSEKMSRGRTRNALIQRAGGNILYFLDDDVIVKKDIFTTLLEKFDRYRNVDIIGGPNLTPPNSSSFQEAQGYVLGSLFGTVMVSYRYKPTGEDKVTDDTSLILCNLAMRKDIFTKNAVLFDDSIVCAEENLLLQQLIQLGYKALYAPQLSVYHERRSTYGGFCEQMFTYGRGRCQLMKKMKRVSTWINFIPSIFLIYLFSLPFYSTWYYIMPLLVYIYLCFIHSLVISFQKKRVSFFTFVFLLYPTIHLVYGAGFIFEMFHVCVSVFYPHLLNKERGPVVN